MDLTTEKTDMEGVVAINFEATDKSIILNNVLSALKRVDAKNVAMINQLAKTKSFDEIISQFNQNALDAFNALHRITVHMGCESTCKISAYLNLFKDAISMDSKMPLDRFTLTILEYAPEIYAQNDEVFLNMAVPDVKIGVANEFNVFRSQMFKDLWRNMSAPNRHIIRQRILLLTTYAHTFLCKTLFSQEYTKPPTLA